MAVRYYINDKPIYTINYNNSLVYCPNVVKISNINLTLNFTTVTQSGKEYISYEFNIDIENNKLSGNYHFQIKFENDIIKNWTGSSKIFSGSGLESKDACEFYNKKITDIICTRINNKEYNESLIKNTDELPILNGSNDTIEKTIEKSNIKDIVVENYKYIKINNI